MKNFMKSNFENIFQSLRNCHKKLCLATHKLRKGDGQSPTFFSKTAQDIHYGYSDNYPHGAFYYGYFGKYTCK